MGTPYTVKLGDTPASIARQNRLTWPYIYDHPENAEFRRRRPSPNQVVPGDVLKIPSPGAHTHGVRLHFRGINLTQAPFDQVLRAAQAAFGPYGFRVDAGTPQALKVPAADAARLARVDPGCTWALAPGDAKEIQVLAGQVPSSDVLVFFVEGFAEGGGGGFGGQLPGKSACIVSSRGGPWDAVHEVGHVLLGSGYAPAHVGDSGNLMYPDSRGSSAPPALSYEQVAQIKRSRCCTRLA